MDLKYEFLKILELTNDKFYVPTEEHSSGFNQIEIYDMEVFIGEIIETYVNEDLLTDGFPDTKKINPLIYSMDNNYWEIGDFVGNAFNIGKNIK